MNIWERHQDGLAVNIRQQDAVGTHHAGHCDRRLRWSNTGGAGATLSSENGAKF